MKIKNPLNEFQSYSVHYIVTVCRTTQIAAEFAKDDPTTASAALTAISKAEYLGAAVPFNGNTSDIYLLIDTRRFAQFAIEDLTYEVGISGLTKQQSTSNLVSEVKMTVVDSVGISFATFMQYMMDERLKANFDGMIFMLQIIFVGHLQDGTTKTIQTETIPMHLARMDINLDYAKGVYQLEFMPNMNFDVVRNKRYLSIASATTYYSGPENTLGGMIASVQNTLNRKSAAFYDAVQEIVNGGQKTADTEKKQQAKKPFGRKVQYMITVPEKWKTFVMSATTVGEVKETKPTAEKPTPPAVVGSSYAAAERGEPITTVLDRIFRQVPDITKMGNFTATADQDGSLKFYKYIVSLTSDHEMMVVHVDVVEFTVPNVFNSEAAKSKDGVSKQEEFYFTYNDPQTGENRRAIKDYIEYDYIWTGLNTDILSFDTKIQDFQMLLAANLRVGDSALKKTTSSNGKIDNADAPMIDDLLTLREFDPILPPHDTISALENFRRFNTIDKTQKESKELAHRAEQYAKNLSIFYAGSPITTNISIRGNPLIMQKFNMGKLGMHVVPEIVKPSQQNGDAAAKGGADQYRKYLEEQIIKTNGNSFKKGADGSIEVNSSLSDKSYAVSPVFVKINVFGPKIDFRTNGIAGDVNDIQYVPVLSDNYYVVDKVVNSIRSGVFTQELSLRTFTIFGKSRPGV